MAPKTAEIELCVGYARSATPLHYMTIVSQKTSRLHG